MIKERKRLWWIRRRDLMRGGKERGIEREKANVYNHKFDLLSNKQMAFTSLKKIPFNEISRPLHLIFTFWYANNKVWIPFYTFSNWEGRYINRFVGTPKAMNIVKAAWSMFLLWPGITISRPSHLRVSPALLGSKLQDSQRRGVEFELRLEAHVFSFLWNSSILLWNILGPDDDTELDEPITSKLFPERQILDYSKLKECADDNVEFDKNCRKFSKE